MKRSSLTVTYAFVLLTILLLSELAFARPFDWHYSRFATPFALFCNPALLGSNPGPTIGFDTRYADTTDYDARLAVTIPLSKVLKREEHQREIASSNRKYSYAYPSYMSSERSISFGGIYAGGDNYNLSVGFTSPIRVVQTGVSLSLAHQNKDNVIGFMNLGLSANVMTSGIVYFIINNINLYNFTNMMVGGNNSATDFGLSIGTSGSPFIDTNSVFLPYDILFTYTPKGDVITVGTLAGMLRLNLDLTHIYTSRDITGQTAVASIGYGFLRDEYGRVSHSLFASLGLEFVNKASSAALAGGYGVRSKRSDEVHGAFMYSVVNKTGVGNDNDLVSRIYCSAVDSNRVIFGLYTGGADINSWVMKIETHGGDNIKTFSGGNVIPASIIWDGLNSEGNKLEDDIVYVKLAVRGKNKVVESTMVSVEIIGGKPRPKRDL
jgi:hypothetical protein